MVADAELHIRLTDDGCGIDPESLEIIFQPFEHGAEMLADGYPALPRAAAKNSLTLSIPISRNAGPKQREVSFVKILKTRRTGYVQETSPAMKAIAR